MPVDIPSYQCRPGDQIRVLSKIQTSDSRPSAPLPSHITFDTNAKTYQIKQVVPRSEVSCSVNELLIIEYYSRKV
jgi:small subunit ribosomal protein S4